LQSIEIAIITLTLIISILKALPAIKVNPALQSQVDKYKAIISLGNFLVLKGIFRAPFSDFQNVTLYPREILMSFKLLSDSSFTSPELLLRSWISGYSFLEIPVSFIPRLHGQAKGTSLKAITKSIREIYEFRTKHWRNIIKNSGGPKGVVSTLV
jgi:hypothetical protein